MNFHYPNHGIGAPNDVSGIQASATSHTSKIRSAFGTEFSQSAPEEGSAFVQWVGGNLDDTLCEQYERTVSADNCVRFKKLILQIAMSHRQSSEH